MFTDTLWVKLFARIALSRTVFKIFVLCIFEKNVKNSKSLPFLAEQNFFEN